MLILFACRRGRFGDIGPVRTGARNAGHRFWVMELPFAAPLLVLAALLRVCGLRVHLVLSDKMIGDTWLARLFGENCTRMMWNYADEWPERGTRLPVHKVCFFREAGFGDVDLFVFAPERVPRPQTEPAQCRPIVFVGDVSTDFHLPQGAEWWRERLAGLRDEHGYGFYLRPEYEALISGQLQDRRERRLARVLAKNLLRLWIVQAARAEFGERVILVGSNWRKFSLPADPSSYSESVRLDYFRSATVNLDCASKSGDSALYPRSSEIITHAGGILQVGCVDARLVYGNRVAEFCFHDRESLRQCIDARLRESAAARQDRDEWLLTRLAGERLLMRDSIDRMLSRAPC
jgi:hypothetical protein